MKVQVGISTRRAKKLAAGAIAHSDDLGMWHVLLYMVIDGKVVPIAEQGCDTQDEATSDLCETLKIKPGALVEMDEEAVDDYILKNTRNQWSVP